MDALDTQSDEKREPWPISPGRQASSMTLTTRSLTPVGSLFSLPIIPSFLTYISGVSGDLENNTLHYDDVNTESFAPDLTVCMPSLDYSSSSLSSNAKKDWSPSSIERTSKAQFCRSILPFETTICHSHLDSLECASGSTKYHFEKDSDSPFAKRFSKAKTSNQYFQPPDPTQKSFSGVSTSLHSIVAYDLIGIIGRRSDRRVLLSRKCDPKGGLYTLRTIRGDTLPSLAEELALLRLVSRASNADQLGASFLQTLVDDFQDENYLYIILEHLPATLSTPDIAAHFRIQKGQHPASPTCASSPCLLTDCISISTSPGPAVYHLHLLLGEISLGLLYLHENGIVHQDIKPATIMVSNRGHVVIGDFGAATRLSIRNPESPQIALESATGSLGVPRDYGPIILQPDDLITFTPLYAAPELRQRTQLGLVIYDERVDWWAFGILIYELITGTAPPHPSYSMYSSRCGGDESSLLGNTNGVSIDDGRYSPLKSFLRALLTYDSTTRLSGLDVKKHPFFNPISGLWSEIAALKHPPCPGPSTYRADQSVSFDFDPPYGSSPHRHTLDRCVSSDSHSPQNRQPTSIKLGTRFTYLSISDSGCGTSQEGQQAANGCWFADDYEESDRGSDVQALPSTASIYFYAGRDTSDGTLTGGTRSTMDNITGDVSQNGSFESMQQHIFGGRFQSRCSSDFRLGSSFGPRGVSGVLGRSLCEEGGPRHFTDEHFTHTGDCLLTLPQLVPAEKITLSLLQAMDNRDNRETTRHQRFTKTHKVAKRNHLTQACYKLTRTVARCVSKGLRFW